MVHVAPEARILAAPRSWVAIRGHFDDPRSQAVACPGSRPIPGRTPGEQMLWCRQQLVITSIEPVPAPTPFGD